MPNNGFWATAGGAIGSMFGAPNIGASLGAAVGDGLQDIGGDMLSGVSGGISGALGGKSSPSLSPDQKADIQFQGNKSALQGPTPPPVGSGAQPDTSGSQAPKLHLAKALGDAAGQLMGGTVSGIGNEASQKIIDRVFKQDPIHLAKTQGKAAKAYMDTAYPGTNMWDKLGQAGAASGAVTTDTSNANQRVMQGTANKQQNAVVSAQNANAASIAGLSGAVNYVNTHDTIRQKQAEINAHVAQAQADVALKTHQAGAYDASRDASEAAAGSSRAATALTQQNTKTAAVGTEVANATKGAVIRQKEQEAENAKYPSVAGGIWQTAKSAWNETGDWVDKKGAEFGNWLGDLQDHYTHVGRQLDASPGIIGATTGRKQRKH